MIMRWATLAKIKWVIRAGVTPLRREEVVAWPRTRWTKLVGLPLLLIEQLPALEPQ